MDLCFVLKPYTLSIIQVYCDTFAAFTEPHKFINFLGHSGTIILSVIFSSFFEKLRLEMSINKWICVALKFLKESLET